MVLRRAVALAVPLALALLTTAQASVPVRLQETMALVEPDGGEALRAAEIFGVSDGLFAAGEKGAYRLYDDGGNLVCDAVFSMLREAGKNLIFRRDGLCGAMTREGAVIVEPVWAQLVGDGAGGFLALANSPLDAQPDAVWHIAPGEEPQTHGGETATGLTDAHDDRVPCMTSDGRWGFLDGRGAPVIQARWRHCGPFADGLAIVTGDGGRGAIDPAGESVIPPEYAWLERGDGVIAGLRDGARLDVFDAAGSPRFSVEGKNLRAAVVGGCVALWDDDGARLYGAAGQILCEAPREASFFPGLDGQIIVADGAWGEACQRLLRPDGTAASDRYQRILPLVSGRYAFLTMNGVTYYSNELGGLQKSWDYDSVRYGLMDGEGREILPATYRDIRPAGADRLALTADGAVLLADLDGNVVRAWESAEEDPS